MGDVRERQEGAVLLPSSLPTLSSLALALASLDKKREQLEVLRVAEGVLQEREPPYPHLSRLPGVIPACHSVPRPAPAPRPSLLPGPDSNLLAELSPDLNLSRNRELFGRFLFCFLTRT